MSNYWKNRTDQLIKAIDKMDAEFSDKLIKKYFEKEFKETEKLIGSYFAKYGKDNVIKYADLLKELPVKEKEMLYKDWERFIELHPEHEELTSIRKSFYKLTRLEGLQYDLLMKQLEFGDIERKEFEKYLTKVFKTVHHKSFNMYDEQALKLLLNKKWCKDKNFSDRVWGNREKLTEYIVNNFSNAVIRGDNYQTVITGLKQVYPAVRRRHVERLVRTEATFVLNEAMGHSIGMKDNDEYIFSAVMDSRTSQICEHLNGEKFLWKDRQPGINFPPMHVNCRSSFDEVVESIYDIKRDLEALNSN